MRYRILYTKLEYSVKARRMGSWNSMIKGFTKYFSSRDRAWIGVSSIVACRAQCLVSCRSLSAVLFRMIGGNVAGTVKSPMMPQTAETLRVIHAVHRQPK